MKLIWQHLAIAFVFASVSGARGQEPPRADALVPEGPACGDVSVAKLNWNSAAIFAHIDAFVLEHGYGCDVELVPGDTMSTLTSMVEEARPDVSPETWINSGREMLDEAAANGDLHYMAPAFADGGIEGWWIPHYVAEAHPEIKTVAGALEHPELFPSPENPSRGAVHSCPEGWSCEISTTNLFRAYEAAEKGFDLIEAPTGEALEQSIAEAFAEREGWLGYYWAPTAALGRFDMVKLNFDAPYDEALWNDCMIDPDCPAPRITSWPRSEVYTVVTDDFARRGNGALGYLRKRSLTNETLNDLLAWEADNDASAQETALHFLRTQDAVWREFVPEAVAGKIADALGDG